MTALLASKRSDVRRYLAFLSLTFLVACGANKPQGLEHHSEIDSAVSPTITEGMVTEEEVLPVFGYRFHIEGDFDGDGNTEVLTEHFFDGNTHKETNKFYSGLSYEELVERTLAKAPYSFATCNNPAIDTVHFARKEQLLGLSYLKNEGDLNGDGTDEISYVINWADWSNVNTCHVSSFKNGQWVSLYSFAIRDWQLPNLPETIRKHGPLGLKDMQAIPHKATFDQENQEAHDTVWNNFEGLIKPVAKNVIQVIYMNQEAITDTMLVDLSEPFL